MTIVNARMPEVVAHVSKIAEKTKGTACPLRLVVKSTPSSMHSFYEISPMLTDAPFCLTTVDTIFREDDFAKYVATFSKSDVDGMMAVTDYIDDEKPLYVGTDMEMRITGFYDDKRDCRYISGGIYALKPKALDTLRKCIDEGQSRMRNFQRALVAEKRRLKAWNFSKVLDIDHKSDIQKAEEFL